ncbi:hypothetical protein JZ751_028944 [Albula glossodonta]|uniref:Integrin alpha 6 n=1 Tax=Albula glossodonta TaxID=121402 RepID=A0A8T2MP66_9TELE|nr:hypothetical protein JZ751_028944 [Albula glossodonta]
MTHSVDRKTGEEGRGVASPSVKSVSPKRTTALFSPTTASFCKGSKNRLRKVRAQAEFRPEGWLAHAPDVDPVLGLQSERLQPKRTDRGASYSSVGCRLHSSLSPKRILIPARHRVCSTALSGSFPRHPPLQHSQLWVIPQTQASAAQPALGHSPGTGLCSTASSGSFPRHRPLQHSQLWAIPQAQASVAQPALGHSSGTGNLKDEAVAPPLLFAQLRPTAAAWYTAQTHSSSMVHSSDPQQQHGAQLRPTAAAWCTAQTHSSSMVHSSDPQQQHGVQLRPTAAAWCTAQTHSSSMVYCSAIIGVAQQSQWLSWHWLHSCDDVENIWTQEFQPAPPSSTVNQSMPEESTILIGAPRARALPNQKANVTGGLYSCELSTNSYDCNRVDFDNEGKCSSHNRCPTTCAHRYQRRLFVNTPQESRDITGRCYVLSEDLSIDLNSDEDGGNWKFCEGRARGHERFGSCQQGLSATFSEGYEYVVFGAPGAYNWKGIVRAEQKNSTLLELGRFDDGPYEVGDENRLDPALVPVPANSYLGVLFMTTMSSSSSDQFVYKSLPLRVNIKKSLDVMTNSYLGFSLDSGKSITKKGQLTVVAGAPRANHSGAVVLLKKEPELSRMLSPEFILEGEGLASSFGYDVAVVDLNGDGWQDIAVGAPQFFEKDGEVGGAVYIYINQAGNWDKVKPVRLNGTKDSMFGLAVANIGDINQDSYEALAYSFEAESERRKQGLPSRVTFLQKSSTDQDFQSRGTLELRGQNKEKCIETRLKLQSNIKDKLRGIPIEVSVDIQNARRRRRQSSLPQLPPVLNSGQDTKTTAEISFLKEGCGSDNICQSNLELKYKFCSREPGQDSFKPLPIQTGVPEISLSDQKDIALEITVTNKGGDDAHEARMVGLIPSDLSYSAFRAPHSSVICAANTNGSEVDCELGNPLKRDSSVTFYIILSTADISLNTREVEVDLQLETTSEQKNLGPVKAKAKVVIQLLLSVSGVARPSQVYFGGTVKGESAIKTEDEIGSLIEYEFRIINLGKSLKSFGTASLNIQWPEEVMSGKYLLYLMMISTSGLDKIQCTPQEKINPKNKDYSTMNYVDIIVKASLRLDGTPKNIALKNAESKVRVTVFPEKSAAQYSGVPWWIILVAILAGILMLALLVLLLWKVSRSAPKL